MTDLFGSEELPLGLTMALARNTSALNRFSVLSPQERAALAARARTVRSRAEMDALVEGI